MNAHAKIDAAYEAMLKADKAKSEDVLDQPENLTLDDLARMEKRDNRRTRFA